MISILECSSSLYELPRSWLVVYLSVTTSEHLRLPPFLASLIYPFPQHPPPPQASPSPSPQPFPTTPTSSLLHAGTPAEAAPPPLTSAAPLLATHLPALLHARGTVSKDLPISQTGY